MNKEGKRYPETHQTNKCNQGYLGMKVYIGVDKDFGLIHSVVSRPTTLDDLTRAAELMYGGDELVHGDAGYQGIAKRPEMADKTMQFKVAMRLFKRCVLPDTPECWLVDLVETAYS